MGTGSAHVGEHMINDALAPVAEVEGGRCTSVSSVGDGRGTVQDDSDECT